MSTSHIALLRAINVGGKNKLPMKDLARLVAACGGDRVRTYIQSGNVVFDASPEVASALPAALEAAVKAEFGFNVPVVLRSRDELATVAANNPYLAAGADPDTVHVMLLAEVPAPERIAKLDPQRSPPDAFTVVGRDIYLHLPKGVADSKLTNAYFDKTLGTVSTGRNWRTVLKLLEMASE